MSDLYLSRATLRRDVPSSALRALLVPGGDSARVAAGHRLVWTLFADSPDRERDFLWREADPGRFYFLSRRPPEDRHGLFRVDPPKRFTPALAQGDRLAFVLRANATVSKVAEGRARANGKVRGKPCDVVMNALKPIPRGERAEPRRRIVAEAGVRWLVGQGARAGFEILERGAAATDGQEQSLSAFHPRVRVMGYRTLRVRHGREPAQLGILDFEGVLEVRDPERLVAAIAGGFGRAKAFGCGLMLVRRA